MVDFFLFLATAVWQARSVDTILKRGLQKPVKLKLKLIVQVVSEEIHKNVKKLRKTNDRRSMVPIAHMTL